MINQFTPTLLADPYGQLDSSMPQIPQYNQYQSGFTPFQMAQALRNQGQTLNFPDTDLPQMTNVPGMGNSIGTGLTQNSFNSGIGFNPSAQYGGFGINY